MTETVTTKPVAATCKGCGAAIFWVTMWSGKKMPIEKNRITVINQVKEGVWTTTKGYAPHWGNCPKAGDFRNESNDD